MFENWAADVLANYLGKFVDVQRDRLRISLWGGEGTLENVQLRVDAFDHLQLPFVIKGGSIGRLKLQIPWGRWRGGALVVELSDVALCVSAREESDWEEGPALRRLQATKQAQLAAAELAKLGSRVAATGRGATSHQQADYAAATAAGTAANSTAASAAGPGMGSSWGWAIVDYVASFLLNRLQFTINNVHVYFEASAGSYSEYEAFGVQLSSLSTVVPGRVPDILAAFAGLKPMEPSAAAKVVRQLHIRGWSAYWKPRRTQQMASDHPVQQQTWTASTAGSAQQKPTAVPAASGQLGLHPTDYVMAPLEAVMEVTVHGRTSAGAAGLNATSSISTGLACDVFIGAPEVALQLSTQQLVGMARLADDAATWAKRNKYGRYRPPGWITVLQARRHQNSRHPYHSRGLAPTGLHRSSSEHSRQCSPSVVPTGRCGVGAPVTWLQVWHYAVQAIIADLRNRRRKQQGRMLHRSEVMTRRRYVHLYQQRLDSLQQTPPSSIAYPAQPTVANNTSKVEHYATSIDSSTTAFTAEATAAGASKAPGVEAVVIEEPVGAAGKVVAAPDQDVCAELAKLEQELEVEDILLCRSLAEVALDRRSASSSEAERYRSWFAWGTSAIGSFLYPSTQSAASAGSGKGPAGKTSSSGSGTSMPTEADLDELLSLLHSRNADGAAAGVSAAAATAAVVTGGALGAEAAAIGTATAADVAGCQTGTARAASSPCIVLNWQLLRLQAVVQDCYEPHHRRELLVFDIEGTSIKGIVKDSSLSAQLQLQEFRLFDCCSDPGVRECVLQRLDPASPVAIASRVDSLRPSQGWGVGLSGLGLRQGAGLKEQSPEAYGWGEVSMPAVSSARKGPATNAKSYAAVAAGHLGVIKQPLLSIGVDVTRANKQVAVQLEQLQLLARPGCIVGVLSMLQELPQDTLIQQQKAAAAEIQAAQGQIGAQTFTNHDRHAQQGTHSVQVPPELLQLQLSVGLQEVLVVIPTELNYESGLNAVVHLQGLKLSPMDSLQQHSAAQAAAGESALESSYTNKLLLEEGSEESDFDTNSSNSTGDSDVSVSSSSEAHSHAYTCASTATAAAAAAARDRPNNMQLLQQQYTLQLALMTMSMQQPADSSISTGSSQAPLQPKVQELLKLLAVQGSMLVTSPASALPSAQDANLSSSIPADGKHGGKARSKSPVSWPLHRQQAQQCEQQQQQVPLIKIALQLPPLSSTVTAVLVASLRQFTQVLQRQLRSPLDDFVSSYRLSLPEQLAAFMRKQLEQQPLAADCPSTSQAAADAAASHLAEPLSPTNSDIERWMAAPSARHRSSASAETANGTGFTAGSMQPGTSQVDADNHAGLSSEPAAMHSHQEQQLDRCDSDCLMESMSPANIGVHMVASQVVQQQQQQQDTPAAGAPAGVSAPVAPTCPDVQLFHLDLLFEELDVQYVEDGWGQEIADALKQHTHHSQPPRRQQQTDLQKGPGLQYRLQTSMLRILFRHSRHSSKAEVTFSDLVLQDMLPAPSTAASTPDVKRLLNHVSIDQVQLVWRQQLKFSGVMQETQVALLGLQAQPDSSASISAKITNTKPYQQPASASDIPTTPATQVSVQLHNIALGLDGILKIVAAVEAANAAGAQHQSQPTQQPQRCEDRQVGNQDNDEGSSFALQVQLLQCQLLSCSGNADDSAADGFAPDWRQWEGALPAVQGSSSTGTAAAAGASRSGVLKSGKNAAARQQVVCDLLLDLPLVNLNIVPQPQSFAAASNMSFKERPVLLVEGLSVYVPESTGSDHLLPVISVPAVVFKQHAESVDLQQGMEYRGLHSRLVQHLHIPALGASARPTHLQHVVQLVERQQQQWQSWTAAIPKRGKQENKPEQKQQQYESTTLTAALDDVQLLLLAAPGTSDKGLLLHWQQVHVSLYECSAGMSPQQQQQHMAAAAAADGEGKCCDSANSDTQQPLVDAKVCWSELTLHAVQEGDATAVGDDDGWQQAATPPTAAAAGAGAAAATASSSPVQREFAQQQDGQHNSVEMLPTEQGIEQQPQPQEEDTDVELLASSLPAVSWLRHTGGNTSSIKYTPQKQQQHTDVAPSSVMAAVGHKPVSAFATAAAAAAAVSSGADTMTSLSSVPVRSLQQTQSTLSRFLSAKDSWHSMESRNSMLNSSDSFFSPQNSSVFLSAASSLANSSSSSNWSNRQGSSSVGAVQSAAASGSTAAAPTASPAVPIATQDSIIAASWQLDPLGASPSGASSMWGGPQGVSALFVSGCSPSEASAVQPNAVMQCLRPVAGSAQEYAQQSPSSAAAASRASPLRQRPSSGSRSLGRHTAANVWGSGHGSFTLKGSSSPVPLATLSRSNHLSLTGDSSSKGLGAKAGVGLWQGAAGSVSASPVCMGASPGPQHSFSSHWLDIDDEFFSIAGDSSLADDLSTSGDVASEGASPAAQRHTGDINVTDVQLLPLVGFGRYGWQGKARWLLLSFTAGLCNDGGPKGGAAVEAGCRTAAHVTITNEHRESGRTRPVSAADPMLATETSQSAGCSAAISSPEQPVGLVQQHVSVTLLDWQLMINSRCWDMVAGCVLQAANAVNASAATSNSKAAYHPDMPLHESNHTDLQHSAALSPNKTGVINDSISRLVQIQVQQLQVTVFIPPDDAPAVMLPAGTSSQQRLGVKQVSGKDFGPWQDPGAHGSPTAKATAGSGQSSKISPFCSPFTSPAQQQQQQGDDAPSSASKLAAQLIIMRIKASAMLSSTGSSSHAVSMRQRSCKRNTSLQLQELSVPEVSVNIAAAEWHAAVARPSAAVTVPSFQTEQLQLVLVKGLRVCARSSEQVPRRQQQVLLDVSRTSSGQPTVTRLLDDTIAVTLPGQTMELASSSGLVSQAASSAAMHQGFVVDLGSISCWASTMRLSLLINLQQQVLQQLPALTAAAAMAGPGKYRGNASTACVAPQTALGDAAAQIPDGRTEGYLQSALSAAATPDMQVVSTASGLGSRGPSNKLAVSDSEGLSCSVTIHKVAVLVSTDEPEPWLLQPSSSNLSSRTPRASASAIPDRSGALPAASRADSTFAVCTTPLLELALLPLSVHVQISNQTAAAEGAFRAGRSATLGTVVRVSVESAVRADVYSVDKLGWEPVLDPWCLQASLEFAQSGTAATHASSESLLKAAISASNLLDLTISPSCIIALQQLQALTAAATAWQADSARLQQLLQCLSSPSAAATLTSGGRGCWLINQTGAQLTYTVADAASVPAAAEAMALGSIDGVSNSSSSPGFKVAGVSGLRGQAANQVPVPLPVLDMASAGYYGRYVEAADGINGAAATGNGRQQHTPSGAADGGKRFQLLYLQASGQPSVIGPIALDKLGCSLHNMAQPSLMGVGALTTRAAVAAGGPNRRSRQHQLVVETSRHHYGGRLVSLHSTVQLVNNCSLQLQLGWHSLSGQTGEPIVFDTLGPGGSLWLPLQVLQSSTPSLCLRPAGAAAERYSWCRAFDPLSLLPATHTTAAPGTVQAEDGAAGAAVDDTGFWYCPRKPKATNQYITFRAKVRSQQQMPPVGQGSSGGGMVFPGDSSNGRMADADGDASQVVLSLGCSALPWPSTASSTQTTAGGAGSGLETGHASSATGLWKLVVEAPAVFINQLPVPVQVSVLAGKGKAVGLQAVVASRQMLPVYGCEAQYLSSMQVQVSGFQQSKWIPISTTPAPAQTSELPAGHPGSVADCSSHQLPGESHGGVDSSQLVQDLSVVVSGTGIEQPGQTLKLRTSRSHLTGSLSISLSCSLWLFNCLGFQVAVKQPGAGSSSNLTQEADRVNFKPSSPLHRRAAVDHATRSDRASTSSSASNNHGAGDAGMLWLKPYPWLADSVFAPGLKDLTGHRHEAAATAVSMAASTSASTLARSASTPALSTLGLGALTSPTAANASAAHLAGSITPQLQQQQMLAFTPARVCFDPELVGLLSPRNDSRGLQSASSMLNQSQDLLSDVPKSSNLDSELCRPSLRRSLSSSSVGMPQFLLSQQQRQQQHAEQVGPESVRDVSVRRQGPLRPRSAHAAADATASNAAGTYSSQESVTAAAETAGGLRRQRRHSSGLFILASGRLPGILQDGEMLAAKAGGVEVDMLDTTSRQQLHHGQPPTAVAGQQRPLSTEPGAAGNYDEPMILPLQDPTQPSAWLPLLAAGNLHEVTCMPSTRLAAFSSSAAAAAMPNANSQQRSAEAAAITEQLLAELSGGAAATTHQRHSAPSGSMQPTAALAIGAAATARPTAANDGMTLQPAVGLGSLMPSAVAGDQAVLSDLVRHQQGRQLAPLASVASSTAASAALDGVSYAVSQTAQPTAAAPVLCGWPCHIYSGGISTSRSVASEGTSNTVGQSTSSIDLQVCAAPATFAAASHRGMQQAPITWSPPATVELRQGGSGPASVLKLPLALPGFEPVSSRNAFSGLESVAATEGDGKVHPSASSTTLASLGSGASSAAAGQVPGQRATGSAWSSRRRDGHSAAQQQGVCYVSVHTVPIPGGGGAWAVHLLPTYLLYNTLQCEVQLRQYGSDIILQTVPPGGYCCVLWPDAKLPLKLQFRVAEPGWSWSGAAAVEAPGEFLVKIRHRNRGETLLLQLDVVAASSGSSMVATLSAPEGGFSPYRLDNCSCETIHVQQVGCVEQEDVLQPYSSLPFAWDEPSLPHRVLLFLPGHRLLGEIPLEQVGQSRRVSIAGHKKRTLLLTTYAEGPMRVLRILDTSIHLLQQQQAAVPVALRMQRPNTAVYGSQAAPLSGYSSTGSQVASGYMSRSRSSSSNHLQLMSRSSSSASVSSSTHQAHQQQQQQQQQLQRSMTSNQASVLQGWAATGAARPADKLQMLRRLGAFLGLPTSPAKQQLLKSTNSDTAAVNIVSPSVDIQVQLQGFGVSLVSETRELLYLCARSINSRFCQDSVRNAVGFSVGSIRVENTLYGCQYPLLLVSPVGRSVFGVIVPPVPAAAATGDSSRSGSGEAGTNDGTTAADEAADVATAAGVVNSQADRPSSSTVLSSADDAESTSHPAAESKSSSNPANGDQLQQLPYQHSMSQQTPPAAAAANSGVLAPVQQQSPVLLPHHLAVGVLATVWRSRPSGVVCIEQLGLQVSPCALSLEGKHIKQLVDFFTSLSTTAAHTAVAGYSFTSRSGSSRPVTHQWQQPVRPPSISAAAAKQSHMKLYVEDLRISAITLCVSFAPDSWFEPLPGVISNVTATPRTDVATDLAQVGPLVTLENVADQIRQAQDPGTSSVPESSYSSANIDHQGQSQAPASSIATDIVDGQLSTESGGVSNAAAASGQQPIWLQMALALAHAEEGAWLTLGAYETSHACVNTDSLGQVLGRHYILAAYRELPKVLASLDILGDPARLLQALGLGFWHLLTLPAHSARWGPYRSLQRLLRGVRVMAYGISSSIAKGSKRSKAALLPLVPAGLNWQQQQPSHAGQQQASLVVSGSAGRTAKNAAEGLGHLWHSGSNSSVLATGDALAPSIASDSSDQTSGQDLLHVLVAGYSLTFQQMLRSFQTGHPVRAVVTAAAQALVLPALLLLEISESTASSFRRLLVEQVAGAVPVRIPRYVAVGQLLRPYDRLESLGRVLLHHAPGPFACEEFLGCVELQLGLYAVVTVGHVMVLACHVKAAGGVAAGSTAAPAASGSQQQQQQAVYVQYKHPELLFVLGVKDVMMVAVEGAAVRLLCISGNHAVSAAAGLRSAAVAADGHAAADPLQQEVTGVQAGLAAAKGRVSAVATAAGSPAGGAAGEREEEAVDVSCQGLRDLVSTESGEELPQQQSKDMEELAHAAAEDSAVMLQHGAATGGRRISSGGSGNGGKAVGEAEDMGLEGRCSVQQQHSTGQKTAFGVVSSSYPSAAAPSTADATAAATAAGTAAAISSSSSSIVGADIEGLQGGSVGHEVGGVGLTGGKWFVGHVVPCGSKEAARELQQLLQKACSRLDTLISSSVWQRQLML